MKTWTLKWVLSFVLITTAQAAPFMARIDGPSGKALWEAWKQVPEIEEVMRCKAGFLWMNPRCELSTDATVTPFFIDIHSLKIFASPLATRMHQLLQELAPKYPKMMRIDSNRTVSAPGLVCYSNSSMQSQCAIKIEAGADIILR